MVKLAFKMKPEKYFASKKYLLQNQIPEREKSKGKSEKGNVVNA